MVQRREFFYPSADGRKKLSLSFFTPPTACGKILLNFDQIKNLTDQGCLKNAETPHRHF